MQCRISLCDDVIERIVQHACAMRIQLTFGRRMFRHATLAEFAPLRRRLVGALNADELDELSSSPLVRCEWRCEPQSWVDEFDANHQAFHTILAEVRDGLWKQGVLS